MVDILELLKKDFPNHTFEIKNQDGSNILYADGNTVIVKWALVTEQDFLNQILVESLEKELYAGIKNSVNKFISGVS
jgi:prepilin-type processing-associated H-X9-DG protein